MRDDGPTVREITTAVYVVPTGAVDMMARLAALFPGLVRSHYLGLRAPGRRSRPRHRVRRRPFGLIFALASAVIGAALPGAVTPI